MPLKCLKGHVHGRSRSLEPREPPSAAELIVTMPIVRRVRMLFLLPAAGIGRELMSGVEWRVEWVVGMSVGGSIATGPVRLRLQLAGWKIRYPTLVVPGDEYTAAMRL